MLRSAAASSLRKFKSDADTNNLNERFQVIPDLSGSKYVPSELPKFQSKVDGHMLVLGLEKRC